MYVYVTSNLSTWLWRRILFHSILLLIQEQNIKTSTTQMYIDINPMFRHSIIDQSETVANVNYWSTAIMICDWFQNPIKPIHCCLTSIKWTSVKETSNWWVPIMSLLNRCCKQVWYISRCRSIASISKLRNWSILEILKNSNLA